MLKTNARETHGEAFGNTPLGGPTRDHVFVCWLKDPKITNQVDILCLSEICLPVLVFLLAGPYSLALGHVLA